MKNIEKHTQNIETKRKKGQGGQGNKPLYFYPKEVTSISALQSFEYCPLSFYLKYYLGLKFPEIPRLKLGKQFQDMLNRVALEQPYNDILNQIDVSERVMAKKLIKQAKKWDNIVSVDTEYKIDLGLGIPVVYIPDLVIQSLTLMDRNINKYIVVENKYTSGYYNENMVNEQKQGTLYYLGIKKKFGLDTEVIYQIFNKRNGKVKLIETRKKTQKDIDNLLFWMDEKLRQIQKCNNTGIWNIGSHARFDCDLGIACPIKK